VRNKQNAPQIPALGAGAAALYLVTAYYGKAYTEEAFLRFTGLHRNVTQITRISEAAEKLGFRARCIKPAFRQLQKEVPFPCIGRLQNRYVLLMRSPRWNPFRSYQLHDLEDNTVTRYSTGALKDLWTSFTEEDTILMLEPSFNFDQQLKEEVTGTSSRLSWRLVMGYFRQSRWLGAQVFMALLLTAFLQLIFPFLMQATVDIGISMQSMSYIKVILAAECMLIFSLVTADFIRSRLLLHISTIANIAILSDFWIKLTRLPLSYFDRQHTGEIMQRVQDNRQIQSFFTGPALNTLFALLNFVVFAVVLMMYHLQLFLVFCAGMVLYFLWMALFLRIRRKINYQLFHASSTENNATLQMVQGMQEIRLQNAGQLKRWEWETVQAKIFRLNFKNLTYGQLQTMGAVFINQGKNVAVTFMVATLVIQGKLTLGAMLAIQYIIGQLSGPVEQFIGFVQVAQDTKISIERLNEVHRMKDEEDSALTLRDELPADRTITLQQVSFSYPGNTQLPVLHNVQLEIPEGKTTAIVGVSGSGKTTLLKLLLKFYDGYTGNITIGGQPFDEINPSFWRKNCGAVLQDGYVFNDTIARNIAVEYETPDQERLIAACKTANLLSFIESLPDGFDTRLGMDGMGMSQGQKQRLLIARAVYKDPAYLFFDESTNALDANNEQIIMNNLQAFFRNRTVIVVAHRLSTVKNADRIIVLHKGCIIEEGSHQSLSSLRGTYFELVRNQLELGV